MRCGSGPREDKKECPNGREGRKSGQHLPGRLCLGRTLCPARHSLLQGVRSLVLRHPLRRFRLASMRRRVILPMCLILSNGRERLSIRGSRRLDGTSGLDRVGDLRVDRHPATASCGVGRTSYRSDCSILIENRPWPCPLTLAETRLEDLAGNQPTAHLFLSLCLGGKA